MKKVILITSILFSAVTFAQEKMTNKSVLALKKAGFEEVVIATKITTATDVDFDVSDKTLLQLKKQGLSELVLSAMIGRQHDKEIKASEKKTTSKKKKFSLDEIEFSKDLVVVNGNIELKKGDKLKIYLPSNSGSTDFSHIKPKPKGALSNLANKLKNKIIDKAVNEVGSEISIDYQTAQNIAEVVDIGSAIYADRMEKLSKEARDIAGKEFEITIIDGKSTNVEGVINGKKYITDLESALRWGELRIQQ